MIHKVFLQEIKHKNQKSFKNKIMKHISKFILFSLGIGSLFLHSCSTTTAEGSSTVETSTPPEMEFSKAVELSPEYGLSLPGDLKPYEQVQLHAKVSGFVQKIFVDRGSRVRKGQLLAILEAPEITQQYLSAKAEEAKLEQELIFSRQIKERMGKANSRAGAVAASELEKAESAYQRSLAALNAAKAKTAAAAQLQSYLKIQAPFDGIVTDRSISVGALVGHQSDALFHLAQTQKLRLTVAIPEKQANSLNSKSQVEFTVSSLPGKIFQANLSRSSNFVQNTGRALIAEFDVENREGLLNGGEYAQVKMNLQRKGSSIFVPESSIVYAQSGTFVWKADESNQLERIDVTVGVQLDTLREVFGNLLPGQKILKKGSEEAGKQYGLVKN